MAATPKPRPAPLEPPKTNGKPKAGRRVNLNDRLASARAARAEAQGEAPVLEVGDPAKEFVLPVEMPYTFLHHCQQGQFIDAASILGGDDLAKAVMALNLSVDDLETFFEAIAEDLYGVTEGK